MISCWVAENNGWKYACHNTVPEQLRLIHFCSDSQAVPLLDSWDCAVVYLLARENFIGLDDKERAMVLGCNLCHLAISQVHPHLPGALQPSSPSEASHVMCSWLATHCDLPGCGVGWWRQEEAGRGSSFCTFSGGTGAVRGKHTSVWALVSVLGPLWVLWLHDSIMTL